MSDFKKFSRFEPPASQRERELWLVEQEDRIARRVVNALAAIVDDATDEYLNTLTAAGDMGVFDGIPARWGLFVDNYLLDELSGMYLSGGLTAWITADAAVGLPERVVAGFTQVINQNAVEYAQIAQNRMKDVGLTTWNLIKDRVSKAVLTGESVEKTRDAIRTNTGFAKKRAEMIARTETINAFNNGDWAGDQALGEFGPVYKYWVATLDARGRETHIATNRQVKLMAEPFIVGGEELLFPHSPGASAKNVVNCRCVYNKLWPGDPHPVTGEPMPEPDAWVDPTAQTQALPVQTIRPLPTSVEKQLPAPNPKPKLTTQHPNVTNKTYDFTGKDARRGQEILDESFDDWRSSLSAEETASLRSYTGSGYVKMNKALRLGKAETDQIRAAREALERAEIPADVVVQRGIFTTDRSLTMLKKGDVFHDAAFQSTSTNAGFGGNMKMRIFVPKGSKGAYLGQGKHSLKGIKEGEVLLPPGATYKVVGRSTINGENIMDVVLVAQGNPPPAGLVR